MRRATLSALAQAGETTKGGEEMKASFNGARRNLASAYNRLALTSLDEGQRDVMLDLHNAVVALLCMYDPDDANDCDDLSETVELALLREWTE